MASGDDFTWRDGGRTVRFGASALADAPQLLGPDYAVLTTPRCAQLAPAVIAGAAAVHHAGPGRVDELADELLATVDPSASPLLVAVGGGRVIDTVKALVATTDPDRGIQAAAIPTTLSAAEMTWFHRRAAQAPPPAGGPRFVRPSIVINDPALCASQPIAELVASAGNALGHAIEGPVTVLSSPVPALAARRAADLIAGALAGSDDPDRAALALAALLSGYTIDSTGYGLHHVMSQTLSRAGRAAHGTANVTLLPHTARALQARFPDQVRDQDIATAARLADRTGQPRLRDHGIAQDALLTCAQAASERTELQLTPPAATREELLEIYTAAW